MRYIIVTTILLVSNAYAGDLLYSNSFTYKGAFALPTGDTFQGGGTGLAYNPENNSLFLFGNQTDKKLSEITIPELVITTDTNELNRATFIQSAVDIFDGQICYIGAGGASKCGATSVLPGGTLVYPSTNRLVVTAYMPYDSSSSVVRSHFTANKDWSSLVNGSGAYTLEDSVLEVNHRTAGFVGGYMAWVPSDKQNDFGAVAVTGQAALSIITRTSYGPSLFLFDPDSLTGDPATVESNPITATPLVYYPAEHTIIGDYGDVLASDPNPSYNRTTQITGVVWPENTDSVLFFGRTSTGSACYGFGTDDMSEEATHDEIVDWINTNGSNYTCGSVEIGTSGNDSCCYDGVGSSTHGTHGYPYAYYVWAYDVADLLEVKNGTKAPWEVTPYAEWDLNSYLDRFLSSNGVRSIPGVAYNSSTQTIYIAQYGVEGTTIIRPVIHAFQLTGNNSKNSPSIKNISEN